MKLDFFTLYVVIVALSLSLAAIWGAIAWQHRSFGSAAAWFLASLAGTAGGLLLPFQYGRHASIVAAGGNGLIILSFWIFAAGLRRLHGQRPGWSLPIAASALSGLLTLALFPDPEFLALTYAFGQMIPMAAMLLFLRRPKRWSIGAAISAGGLVIGMVSHGVVAGMNIVILQRSGATPDWSAPAALTMLGVIFSGLLLNFGFAVMTIDHLRNELADLADIDPLTGVLNRRGFQRWLASDAPGEARAHGVMLLDLDDFKRINDQYGHIAGDEGLIHFAAVVRSQLDDKDMLVRLGGDEFCILVPDGDAQACGMLAAAIDAALATTPLHWNRHSVNLQCSIGTTIWHHRTGSSHEEAFALADQAMYASKAGQSAQGGNALVRLPL